MKTTKKEAQLIAENQQLKTRVDALGKINADLFHENERLKKIVEDLEAEIYILEKECVKHVEKYQDAKHWSNLRNKQVGQLINSFEYISKHFNNLKQKKNNEKSNNKEGHRNG